MTELPTAWVQTTLGQLGGWSSGGTPSRKNPSYFGGNIPWVKTGDLNDTVLTATPEFITEAGLHNSAAKLFPPGTLLVAMYGATIGKTAVLGIPAATNQACAALLPGEITSDLIPYVWKFLIGNINELKQAGQGGAQLNISQEILKALPIPLAPLPEQRRIVAKLDSLRSRSSRARQELDHIPKLIERYKQAILAKAFSGQLIGLIPEDTAHPHEACWNLPKSWRWVRFDEAAEIASNLVPTSEVQQLPHIAPDNIGAGTGKLLAFFTVAEDGVKSPKHRFYPGQVLYSKIRPYLRKAVLIDFEGVCSADMYPLNAKPNVVPRYLYYWAFSQQLASFVVDHEGRTVLPKVNQVGLNQTPFPLAPEPDQQAIVKLLDRAFAWLDRITAEHAYTEHLLPKLDQAILAKAFRGELVPQDPNDEPASDLLKRIKAERNTQAGARRRGRNPQN
ncbi:restriction endonuclease subunit S [Phreatobacter sp.]|uniref:restriction endonuclease subunit S n=1 Tax=Phreatobacter sp. TaxID=1966341 RepID=UPI0022C9952F|nr:restriction endonuclease subunit S [Phreatobacter sp.]MCZ8314397.1 restriction endonuclease subunit S [Phreatobacter sp.]